MLWMILLLTAASQHSEAQPRPPLDCFGPEWSRTPSKSQLDAAFPTEARLRGETRGHAVLECVPSAAGALRCSLVSESPEGLGFGREALRLSKHFVMRPNDLCHPPGRAFRLPIRLTAAPRE